MKKILFSILALMILIGNQSQAASLPKAWQVLWWKKGEVTLSTHKECADGGHKAVAELRHKTLKGCWDYDSRTDDIAVQWSTGKTTHFDLVTLKGIH